LKLTKARSVPRRRYRSSRAPSQPTLAFGGLELTVIHVIGPGGAGKSTAGPLVAARLGVAFYDLDARFAAVAGDIDAYPRGARLRGVRPA